MAGKIETIITAKDQASKVYNSFTASVVAMNQGLELANKAFRALSAPIAAVVSEGREFNRQMSAVKSISNITAQEFGKLRDEAKRLGATTEFTGVQAGEMMEALTRAGQDADTAIATAGHAMALASAQSIDLAKSANTVAVQLNLFQKSGLTAETAVDLMNKTLGKSPQEFFQLEAALRNASQSAAAVDINFQELNEILGAFAETGLTGERAGTALKIALNRLAAPTTEAKKALESYGISLDQVNPLSNDFADILDVLKDKQVSFSDVTKIFGQEAGPNLVSVINKGGDALREFAKKMDEGKTAAQSAADRLNNFDGDVKILNSSLSGLQTTIFDSLDQPLRAATQAITSVIVAIDKFVQKNSKELTDAFTTIQQTIGYVLIGFGSLLNLFASFLRAEGVTSFFSDLEVAIGKVWDSATRLVKAFKDYVDESPALQEAVDKFKTGWSNVFTIIGKVVKIAGNLLSILINVSADALKPLLNDLLPVYNRFMDFMNLVLEKIIGVLERVNTALELKSLTPLISLFDGAQQAIRKFISAVADALSPSQNLLRLFKWLTGESKNLEDQLVTNSTVPAVQELADVMGEAAKESIEFGQQLVDAAKKSKQLEDQVEKTNKDLDKTVQAATAAASVTTTAPTTTGAGAAGTGDQSALQKIGLGALSGAAGQITGASGAISGFQQGGFQGAIAGFAAEIVLSNEKFREALQKVSETLVEVLSPIIEALIPIIEELVPILEELAPLIRMIASFVAPIARGIATILSVIAPTLNYLGRLLSNLPNIILAVLSPIRLTIETLVSAVTFVFDSINDLVSFISTLTGSIDALTGPVTSLAKIIDDLIDNIKKIIPGSGGSGGTVLGGSDPYGIGLGGGYDANPFTPFHNGGLVRRSDLVRLPGMQQDEGVAVLKEGETVSTEEQQKMNGVNLTFNITASDPRATAEEIRQVVEELFLTKRLRVS